MRTHRLALGALVVTLAACTGDPQGESHEEPVASVSAASDSPIQILGLVDRGNTVGRHYFELYGTFPGSNYFARVICNGVEVPTKREYASSGQINLSIPEMATGSSCSFFLLGNPDQNPGNVQLSNAFGPRALVPAGVEILGVNDRGTTSGQRYFELYGHFSASSLSVESVCDGSALPTTITYASAGQVNVALASFPGGSDWTCGFTVAGVVGTIPQRSVTFHAQGSSVHGSLPTFVGAYDWGGILSAAGEPQLAKGAASLRASGFRAARFVLSPRVRGDLVQNDGASLPYKIDSFALNAACPLGTPFLPCAIRSAAYQQAISAPGLDTIVLTTYDSTTSGAEGWSLDFMNETFVNQHADAIVAEYRELTLALFETQRGSGKTFIIANWETDNSLYCGAVYRYSYDAAFRDQCTDVPRRLAGMRRWFQLRQQGIRAGRQLAADRQLGGVTVADGIEFNTFHLLDGLGPNTLTAIIPEVRPDWASYSSYETINKLLDDRVNDVRAELSAIKQLLVRLAPGTQLMIGEVGYNGSAGEILDPRNKQIAATQLAMQLIREADIALAILWVGFDSTPIQDAPAGETRWDLHDGLYEIDGTERLVMKRLRSALAWLPLTQTPTTINGANDLVPTSTLSHVELYGSFPGASVNNHRYAAKAICSDDSGETSTWIAETYESPGQINVAVPRPACTGGACQRSCRFVVYRHGDGTYTQSPASGPIVVRWI